MSTPAAVELVLDPAVRRGYLVAGWLAHPALLTLPLALRDSRATAETIGLITGLVSVAVGVRWLALCRRDARVVVTDLAIEIHSGVGDVETVRRGDVLAVGIAPARHAGGPVFPVRITAEGDGTGWRSGRCSGPGPPRRRVRPAVSRRLRACRRCRRSWTRSGSSTVTAWRPPPPHPIPPGGCRPGS